MSRLGEFLRLKLGAEDARPGMVWRFTPVELQNKPPGYEFPVGKIRYSAHPGDYSNAIVLSESHGVQAGKYRIVSDGSYVTVKIPRNLNSMKGELIVASLSASALTLIKNVDPRNDFRYGFINEEELRTILKSLS